MKGTVFICKECGMTHALDSEPRKCKNCGRKMVTVTKGNLEALEVKFYAL